MIELISAPERKSDVRSQQMNKEHYSVLDYIKDIISEVEKIKVYYIQ